MHVRNYPIILGRKPSDKLMVIGQSRLFDSGQDCLIFDTEDQDPDKSIEDAVITQLRVHLHFCTPEVMRKLGLHLCEAADGWEEEIKEENDVEEQEGRHAGGAGETRQA